MIHKLLSRETELPPDKNAPGALAVYIELLNDEDADVREYAARQIGPEANTAIRPLIRLLNDDDPQFGRKRSVP